MTAGTWPSSTSCYRGTSSTPQRASKTFARTLKPDTRPANAPNGSTGWCSSPTPPGWPIADTVATLTNHQPSADKYGDRLAGEVWRCWRKVETRWDATGRRSRALRTAGLTRPMALTYATDSDDIPLKGHMPPLRQ